MFVTGELVVAREVIAADGTSRALGAGERKRIGPEELEAAGVRLGETACAALATTAARR